MLLGTEPKNPRYQAATKLIAADGDHGRHLRRSRRQRRTMSKFYGNLVLMTVICIVIFWIFMAVHPAHASHARPQMVVGKPKVVTRIVPGSMLPPPKYDKPYDGELEIVFFSSSEDIKQVCPDLHTSTACTMRSVDGKKCFIKMGTAEV